MKLTSEQKLCAEELYLHYAVPTDQLRRKPTVLLAITAAFCNMTGLSVEPAELLRYMMNRRKNRDWPRLGDRAHRFPQALESLSDKHRAALCGIYQDLGITSDEILLRATLAKRLVDAFATRTGRILPAHILVPALFQLRKRGQLPTLCEHAAQARKNKGAFSDIAEVVKRYGKA